MKHVEYWEEAVSEAAYACGAVLTPDQIKTIGEALAISHECYGQAFYQPPASDRMDAIEREWKQKYEALERQFEQYQRNAEKAVGQALNQFPDSQIRIGEYGDVFRYDGRFEQIQ